MYFTRFPINMSRRGTRGMLASPYRLHAAIAASSPSHREGDVSNEGRVLWRIDSDPDGLASLLYIISPIEPNLVALDSQIGWPNKAKQWATKRYDPFLERISVGQRFTFRLVANPTVNRSAGGGKGDIATTNGRSKRIGHLTTLQQAAWLVGKDAYKGREARVPDVFASQSTSRALRNGFRVIDDSFGNMQMVVSHSKKQSFKRGSGGKRITLTTAQYDGVLEVIDPDLLRGALVRGIGHAKGFGCGLLTIAYLGS